MTTQWRDAPNQGSWQVEMADYCGCRISVRYTMMGIYHAFLNGRALGLWHNRDEARAAAERAARTNRRK